MDPHEITEELEHPGARQSRSFASTRLPVGRLLRRGRRLRRLQVLAAARAARAGAGRDRTRRDGADPLAQRGVGEAAVDAGVARLGATAAVARVADEAEVGAGPRDEQRPTGVALAGVHAALREARGHLRVALEATEQRVDALD